MSKRTQDESTNRDQRRPVSGQVYTNGHWVSVDDCQVPYNQEQRNPAPAGHFTYDEDGRQVWSDSKQSEY